MMQLKNQSNEKRFLMFQKSQNDKYLELCINRVKYEYLTWVEQILDIITEKIDSRNNQVKLNDVGCNLCQFYKGLKRRKLNIEYYGYDIESIYIAESYKIFPELLGKLKIFNIVNKQPKSCDISIISATLEHIEDYKLALENLLNSTNQLILLRSFLGNNNLKSIFNKKRSLNPYIIYQFSFNEIFTLFKQKGFIPEIIIDDYTQSKPRLIKDGLIRSCFIIKGERF